MLDFRACTWLRDFLQMFPKIAVRQTVGGRGAAREIQNRASLLLQLSIRAISVVSCYSLEMIQDRVCQNLNIRKLCYDKPILTDIHIGKCSHR